MKCSHERIVADLEAGCWLAKDRNVANMYLMACATPFYEPIVKRVTAATVAEMIQAGLLDSRLQLKVKATNAHRPTQRLPRANSGDACRPARRDSDV